ncbi:MAG: hypothetical protein ACLT4C_01075 [Butyricicoccus sp.]
MIGFAAAAGADHGQLGGDAAAALTVKTGMGQNLDYIIIGNIMLLIPGIRSSTPCAIFSWATPLPDCLAHLRVLRALAIAAGCALVLMQTGAVPYDG